MPYPLRKNVEYWKGRKTYEGKGRGSFYPLKKENSKQKSSKIIHLKSAMLETGTEGKKKDI